MQRTRLDEALGRSFDQRGRRVKSKKDKPMKYAVVICALNDVAQGILTLPNVLPPMYMAVGGYGWPC